jgi:serine/threonine-protein kinase
LHAAHEAKAEDGASLDIVHRDVSPQNVLVGADGLARLIDFGVAKAIGSAHTTRDGRIKGKLRYMPPEALHGQPVTRQCDIYAAAVVAWELLTRQRLFHGDTDGALVAAVLNQVVPPPSAVAPNVPSSFDRVIMRGLEREPTRRYATAREMAIDLERCVGIVSASEVGEWVESLVGARLAQRAAQIAQIEGVCPPLAEPSDRPEPRDDSSADHDPQVSGFETTAAVSQVAVAPAITRRELVTTRSDSPRIRRRLALGGAVGGAVMVACALSLRVYRATPASMPLKARATATSSDGPGIAPTPPPVSSPEAPNAPNGSAAEASPASSHADVGAAVPRPPSASAHTAPPRPLRSPRVECDPPFTIDDRGYKHYKAACL